MTVKRPVRRHFSRHHPPMTRREYWRISNGWTSNSLNDTFSVVPTSSTPPMRAVDKIGPLGTDTMPCSQNNGVSGIPPKQWRNPDWRGYALIERAAAKRHVRSGSSAEVSAPSPWRPLCPWQTLRLGCNSPLGAKGRHHRDHVTQSPTHAACRLRPIRQPAVAHYQSIGIGRSSDWRDNCQCAL